MEEFSILLDWGRWNSEKVPCQSPASSFELAENRDSRRQRDVDFLSPTTCGFPKIFTVVGAGEHAKSGSTHHQVNYVTINMCNGFRDIYNDLVKPPNTRFWYSNAAQAVIYWCSGADMSGSVWLRDWINWMITSNNMQPLCQPGKLKKTWAQRHRGMTDLGTCHETSTRLRLLSRSFRQRWERWEGFFPAVSIHR